MARNTEDRRILVSVNGLSFQVDYTWQDGEPEPFNFFCRTLGHATEDCDKALVFAEAKRVLEERGEAQDDYDNRAARREPEPFDE